MLLVSFCFTRLTIQMEEQFTVDHLLTSSLLHLDKIAYMMIYVSLGSSFIASFPVYTYWSTQKLLQTKMNFAVGNLDFTVPCKQWNHSVNRTTEASVFYLIFGFCWQFTATGEFRSWLLVRTIKATSVPLSDGVLRCSFFFLQEKGSCPGSISIRKWNHSTCIT